MNPRRGCIAALAIALLWPSAAGAANYVILFTARADNPDNPSQQFVMEIEVVLDDIDPADVSGVSVEVDNGLTSLTLESCCEGSNDSTEWEAEIEYEDFAGLKAGLHGTWTITISGTAASTSTFTLDTATTMPELAESDYFPAPSNLVPAHGATEVALDTNFSWTDPTGGTTPDLVEIEVGSETSFHEQSDIFPFDTLLVDDESWDPPLTLSPGESFFFIFYANVDETRVGPLTLTSGSITWGSPEEAAFFDYPEMTPVVLYGSFREIQFDTERLLEDFDAYQEQIDDVGSDGEFFITSGGNPSDPVVASVTDALAGSTSIGVDVNNPQDRVWELGAMSGPTGSSDGTEGFLLIGDIPGFSPSTTGPLADFFSSPRQLFNHSLRARVREPVGQVPTQFRFLVVDASDNEAASPLMPLTTSLTSYEVSLFEFADFDSGPTDFSQIVGLGIEFFTDPATAMTTETPFLFEVDDVEIVAAPEPSSTLLGLTGLAVLALLARRARTGERSRRGLPRGSR